MIEYSKSTYKKFVAFLAVLGFVESRGGVFDLAFYYFPFSSFSLLFSLCRNNGTASGSAKR